MILLTKEQYKEVLDKLPNASTWQKQYYHIALDEYDELIFECKYRQGSSRHYFKLLDEIGITND